MKFLKDKKFWMWYCILWIITVPLTIALFGVAVGLIAGLFGLLVGLSVTAIALAISIIVTLFSLFVTGVALIIGGAGLVGFSIYWAIFDSLTHGFINIGLGIGAFGVGLVLTLGMVALYKAMFGKKALSNKTVNIILILSAVLIVVGGAIFTYAFYQSSWNVDYLGYSF